MTYVIVATGLISILALILIGVGIRSRMIFSNPGALSDSQLAATIALTHGIMQRVPPGSPAWARAAAKHKAALDERLRRSGKEPLDEIEIVQPPVRRG